MRTLYEDLVEDVDYRANEDVIDWTMAQFKGKDKAIDLNLEKNGALILTDRRVIFNGGVILGHGFQEKIDVPLSRIQDVSSERKLFKDEYRKLLVLRWQNNGEKNSAVFLPTDSKNQADGVMKSISSLKPGEKEAAEIWKEKIESKISSSPKQQRPPSRSNDSKDIPPPPKDHQERQQKTKDGSEPKTSGFDCPDCGEGVKSGMSFCPYCGTELDLICSSCGMELKEDWNFCPNCRNQI